MDKLVAMETFVRVVRAGSLSAAARQWGRSKARISQTLAALEAELQMTLLQRTTRSLKLTEAGRIYFERCADLLAQLDALETDLAGARSALTGNLRVTAPPGFALRFLPVLTTSFHEQHPGVSIELDLTHDFVDLIERGVDVAIRVTAPRDSSLIARRLAPAPVVAVAAPSYLSRNGVPRSPEDLRRHSCLVDTNFRQQQRWTFKTLGGTRSVSVAGPFRVNHPEAVHDLAVAGHGVALLPRFVAADALQQGKLVEVLQGRVALSWAVYAIYPRRAHLPERVRAYVEHLAAALADQSL